MKFDFSIEFKQGHTNVIANALSIKDIVENNDINTFTPNGDLMDQIKFSWQPNTLLQELIYDIQYNETFIDIIHGNKVFCTEKDDWW